MNWAERWMRLDDLWKITMGEGVKVAILDTGISLCHPDLEEAIIDHKDFTGTFIEDSIGHGTHCAGIVGGRGNIVGIAPKCQLMIGKVVGKEHVCYSPDLTDAIQWACDGGADIISISLGSMIESQLMHKVIVEAVNKKHWIIAAAGNSGLLRGMCDYPGAFEEVISVGSVGRWPHLASSFSSRGPTLDVMAPGEGIKSCWPPDGYKTLSGTSMSTPFVAGILALCISKHRQSGGLTPIDTLQDVEDHLLKTAIDKGKKGIDNKYGYGIINPKEVIN